MLKTMISKGIFEQASRHPDKPAVIGVDENGVNYADVVRIYKETRAFLADISVEDTDRLAVLTEDGIIYSILALAILEHAVLVPLDHDQSVDKFAYLFDLLNINYIMTDYKSSHVAKIAEESGLGIIKFTSHSKNGLPHCNFELWKMTAKKNRKNDSTSTDLAIINTTSGTTSTPKIVPRTYFTVFSSMQRHIKVFSYDESDVHGITAKLHQTLSLTRILLILFTGGTAIFTNGFRHKEFINLINRNILTSFNASPAILNSLTAYLEESKTKVECDSLRFILSAGAPLTEKLREYYEKIFTVPVAQVYGMTEIGVIATTYRLAKGYKEGTAGVSAGLEIKILNGEVLVNVDSLFLGYENPEESNDNYFIDGWFRTGDAGYLDADGYLYITGRFKEMINRGGEKVSPYEVEKAILEHGAVTDTAVFPIPNSYGSEDVGAAVVLKEGQQINIIELRGFLQQRMNPYKMPTQLYVANEIPIGKNGKVQRYLLNQELQKRFPDQILAGAIAATNAYERSSEGLSATEQIMLDIWKKVLKLKTMSSKDDFFVLGGDSLKIALVYSELERLLGIQVPISVLFRKTTVKELAAYIDSRDMAKSSFKFLVPIKDTGYTSPLFCIHALDGEAITYHSLGEFIEEDRPIYGLRFNLESGEWKHPLTIEQLAEAYALEIQALDPYGPYNLCGTCIGGVLSFAVAQVLIRNGKEVALLAMLDSGFPEETTGKQKLIPLFINSLDELKNYRVNELARVTVKKARSMMRMLLRPSLTKRYINKEDRLMSNRTQSVLADVVLSHAYSNYRPTFLDGTVYYFRALDDKVKQADTPYQWAKLAKRFHLIEIPCRHNEINSPENSKVLIEKFKAIIENLDA